MHFDVVIVGAGPAGLAAAIRLRQLAPDLSVCIVEKGSQAGSQVLSGMVIEPRALNELIPDWRNQGAPLTTPVSTERFLFLSKNNSFTLPAFLLPSQLKNEGNYAGSLANLCRWLGQYATHLGVEIFPGFAAAKVIYEDNIVKGIITGDMGVGKDGQPKAEFTPGIELRAKYTLIAEGCRGSLAQELIKHYQLQKNSCPQTYGLGIKEIWEVRPEVHNPGLVQHTAGWPLKSHVYGGSFIYHLENHQVAVGLVVALDYRNPYLDPYWEMQRFKLHPDIKPLFEGARRIGYGARALNEGGWQSIPELIFPGGALIGCAAGFLNVAKIKGSHNAMKSGMLAAEAIHHSLQQHPEGTTTLTAYPEMLKKSWIYQELYQARNFRPFFRYGLWLGTLLSGIELSLLKGKTPWTLRNYQHDRNCLKKANISQKITYPAPDGQITFDRMSSVYLANIQYSEDQPIHLQLQDPQKALSISYHEYDSPEQRYCPAGVYEIIQDSQGHAHLQINAANCVHCKTCDIKDPANNIVWQVPEGGSGPNYGDM
ncbi:MAG: electron transfer flavoprotein-ubiquinone oxidoreductase [Proteobacteria bacterium]|nr:electron transfer flavoprotein-ubiquinone oxidoreductase [Pseudomonadota bacterium]